MDADLATELKFTIPLINGITEEKYDLTIDDLMNLEIKRK